MIADNAYRLLLFFQVRENDPPLFFTPCQLAEVSGMDRDEVGEWFEDVLGIMPVDKGYYSVDVYKQLYGLLDGADTDAQTGEQARPESNRGHGYGVIVSVDLQLTDAVSSCSKRPRDRAGARRPGVGYRVMIQSPPWTAGCVKRRYRRNVSTVGPGP